MRNKYYLLFLVIVSLFTLSACKDTPDSKSAKTVVNAESNELMPYFRAPAPSSDPKAQKRLADYRSHAQALIDNRMKKEDVYSMIVVGYWYIQFVLDGEISPRGAYDGYFLKFNEDFTYTIGQYEKDLIHGKYHYTLDESKMLFLDDRPTVKPTEWEVKYKEDDAVFIGTNYFGQNARQIKVHKYLERPTRPVNQ